MIRDLITPVVLQWILLLGLVDILALPTLSEQNSPTGKFKHTFTLIIRRNAWTDSLRLTLSRRACLPPRGLCEFTLKGFLLLNRDNFSLSIFLTGDTTYSGSFSKNCTYSGNLIRLMVYMVWLELNISTVLLAKKGKFSLRREIFHNVNLLIFNYGRRAPFFESSKFSKIRP